MRASIIRELSSKSERPPRLELQIPQRGGKERFHITFRKNSLFSEDFAPTTVTKSGRLVVNQRSTPMSAVIQKGSPGDFGAMTLYKSPEGRLSIDGLLCIDGALYRVRLQRGASGRTSSLSITPVRQGLDKRISKRTNTTIVGNLNVGVDVDYESFVSGGRDPGIVFFHALSAVNTAAEYIHSQTGVQLTLTVANVWTISSDPYSSEDSMKRLQEFANSGDEVFRGRDVTLGLLLSTTSDTAAISIPGSICGVKGWGMVGNRASTSSLSERFIAQIGRVVLGAVGIQLQPSTNTIMDPAQTRIAPANEIIVSQLSAFFIAGRSGCNSQSVGNDAPTIIRDIQDLSVEEGATAVFSILADGAPTLRYQWQQNGIPLNGATTRVLRVPNVTSALNRFLYTVVVTNGVGSVTSRQATLKVVTTTNVRPDNPFPEATATADPFLDPTPAPCTQICNSVSCTQMGPCRCIVWGTCTFGRCCKQYDQCAQAIWTESCVPDSLVDSYSAQCQGQSGTPITSRYCR